MAKTRVYELARSLGVETKLLMNTIKQLGIQVSSHQSTLESDQIDTIQSAVKGVSPAKPAAAAMSPASSTIIRRRRGESAVEAIKRHQHGDEEEVPQEAVPSTGEVANVSPALVEEHVEKTVLKKPSATEAEFVSEASKPVDLEAKKADSVDAPVKQDLKVESVSSGTTAATTLKAKENEPIRTKRFEGAKIIRKAPEVPVTEASRDAGRNRREDSRGTKYTGVGSASGAATPPAILDFPPDNAGQPARAHRGELKTRESEEEETKLKTMVKVKKPTFNKRQLLSQISLGDPEEVLEDLSQKKTVFTPSFADVHAKRRDLRKRKDLKKTKITVARAAYRVVRMGESITVADLAKQLKIKSADLIKKLMTSGQMVTLNQSIDFDTAAILAADYSFEVKNILNDYDDIMSKAALEVEETGNEVRAPIVTVMGHVDHGKTSILDAIRKTNVTAGEAGGITQAIGAYSVYHGDQKIAFLDTPGHEAFSSMRARGANITDIVILVVAADDGVMPQTKEAIAHAKEADVPIIVAINKIDKPNPNFDRIYAELAELGVQPEEWGGDVQCIKVSAHTKQGLDDLLDAVLLLAEVLELKTSSKGPAIGAVIEANLDPGRGVVANVMVKHGTLRIGDQIVCGVVKGRVRAMYAHDGSNVQEVGPSTPVQVIGLPETPEAGDEVNVIKDDKLADEVIDFRRNILKARQDRSQAKTMDDLLGRMSTLETPELPIIVKADTQGSVEAIVDAIEKLSNEKVRNKIIHKGAGGVNESDLNLSEASGAIIIAFNVRAPRHLDELAEKRGIFIRYFSIIYDMVDVIKSLMVGKLPPLKEETVVGTAEVKQPIHVPRIGTIAGSTVTDGRIFRNCMLRLIRDDIVIYTGKISSLRRFKEDVKEVKSGFECGISIENFHDVKAGDRIEAFEVKEVLQTL